MGARALVGARARSGPEGQVKSGSGQPRSLNRRREAGQGLVELALVVPVFFIILFAIVDFGLGLKAWVQITNASREAARFAAVTCATNDADADDVIDRAVTTSAGLIEAADVDVDNCPGDSTESVVVTVSHDYVFISPLGAFMSLVADGTLPDSITITSSADMRLE
jgi:Flp pilus assembly protein TadG